jgi:4-amino-4-deoxy-L-arabinose transferase-like glycosyltransferase
VTVRQCVAALILATAVLRIALAWAAGLGVDESYMVAAGRELAWGYFDHPPLAWWLSAGIAKLTGSEAAIVVRLPFIALFAASTWLMFTWTREMFGPRAGLWAAVALNMAPVLGVTTGGWVLPDGPLDAALLGFGLCLQRSLQNGLWRWWLGAGLCAGLALLSKYIAVLTLAGAVVVVLTIGRHWLSRPQPWVAALLAAALFTPVIAWNATHGWASLVFQGARAGVRKLDLAAPFATLAGEALFLLPWLWLPLAVLWARALLRGPKDPAPWLLAGLGFGCCSSSSPPGRRACSTTGPPPATCSPSRCSANGSPPSSTSAPWPCAAPWPEPPSSCWSGWPWPSRNST